MKNVSLSTAAVYIITLIFWLAVIVGLLFVGQLPGLMAEQKSLNILTWGSIFDPKTISSFSQKSGVKVNMSYYSTNEELLVALNSSKGQGYDLIVPSDYAVPLLKQRGLLKRIDKSRLHFLSALNPLLMGHAFDPTNEYSLPYMVEVFGLGYRKSFFGSHLANPSWGYIFKDPGTFKISMVNDPVEAVDLATYYLYPSAAPITRMTDTQISNVRDLLVKQKSWVEAYTDFRPDYFLLTGNCPLVVTQLSSIIRAQSQSCDIGFALPAEGTFISIENFSLPCGSDNESVYDFINYVYTPEIMISHFDSLASVPATRDVLPSLQFEHGLKDIIMPLLTMDRAAFARYALFFAPIMPENELHHLWVEVKS